MIKKDINGFKAERKHGNTSSRLSGVGGCEEKMIF